MSTAAQIREQTNLSAWFEDTVTQLRTHQLMLETNTAPQHLQQAYNILINGNEHQISYQSKIMAQMHFVKSILVDYLKEVSFNDTLKLAVNFNDSEVLVWAEIKDDDYAIEENLLVAEAKINAKYHDFGFDMETTIVEESDRLPIPNHYQLLK